MQDVLETHRPSPGGGTAVASVSDPRGSCGAGDSDSELEVAVLYFDFGAFERATGLKHDDAIELWARWNRIVPKDRLAGPRRQYISLRIEVPVRSVCACACVLGRSFPSSLRGLVLLAWRPCLYATTVSVALESGCSWTSRCFRRRPRRRWISRSPRSCSGAGSRRLIRVGCGVLAGRGSITAWRSFLAWTSSSLSEALCRSRELAVSAKVCALLCSSLWSLPTSDLEFGIIMRGLGFVAEARSSS